MYATRYGRQEKEHLAGRGTAGTPSVLVVPKGTAKWWRSMEEIGITVKTGWKLEEHRRKNSLGAKYSSWLYMSQIFPMYRRAAKLFGHSDIEILCLEHNF